MDLFVCWCLSRSMLLSQYIHTYMNETLFWVGRVCLGMHPTLTHYEPLPRRYTSCTKSMPTNETSQTHTHLCTPCVLLSIDGLHDSRNPYILVPFLLQPQQQQSSCFSCPTYLDSSFLNQTGQGVRSSGCLVWHSPLRWEYSTTGLLCRY